MALLCGTVVLLQLTSGHTGKRYDWANRRPVGWASDLPFGTHFPSHLNSSVEQTDVCRPTPVRAVWLCLFVCLFTLCLYFCRIKLDSEGLVSLELVLSFCCAQARHSQPVVDASTGTGEIVKGELASQLARVIGCANWIVWVYYWPMADSRFSKETSC